MSRRPSKIATVLVLVIVWAIVLIGEAWFLYDLLNLDNAIGNTWMVTGMFAFVVGLVLGYVSSWFWRMRHG